MADFLIDILKLMPFILMPYFWGLDDGKEKRTDTQPHWPKWIIFFCMAYIVWMDFDKMILIGWALVWKPCFDYGYSKAIKLPLYLGNTSWTDRLIKKIFGRFVPVLYWLMIAGGILLMRHLG